LQEGNRGKQDDEDGCSGGMRLVSLRISHSGWEAIQHEARRSGVSASEFLREAAYFRLGYRWAQRMADDELAARLRGIGVLTDRY
jgi:hypothetical protein